MWPEVRIIAGIEASTITSLGTCRLVMPLSESTIASGGPVGEALRRWRPRSPALVVGQRRDRPGGSRRARRSALSPAAASTSPCCANRSREERLARVAEDDRVRDLHHRGLEVHREQHALGLGAARSARRGTRRAQRRSSTVASTTSPASTGTDSLSTVVVPSRADELDAQRVVGLDDDRLLVGAEVAGAHVATLVLESGDHAPIECGWLAGVVLDRARARGGRSCPRAAPG